MPETAVNLPPGLRRRAILGEPAPSPTPYLHDQAKPEPKQEPKPAPIPPPAEEPSPVPALDPAEALAASIRAIAGGVTPAALESIRRDIADLRTKAETADAKAFQMLDARLTALEKAEPKTVKFQLGDFKPGPEIKNARPEVSQIVRRIAAGLRNIWLSGPAGSGKTTLAETVAKALNRRFGAQSFAPDLTSAAIIGGPNAQGVYQETAFIDFYENGGVYLLDEIDAADSGVLLAMNAALANGTLFLPRHNDPARRVIKRHADTVIIAAGNTWGTGPDAQYVGRAQLDAAFLSRFALAQFFIGFDTDLDKLVCPDGQLRGRIQLIRQKLQDHKLRRVAGTREMAHAGQLRAAGFTPDEIIAALTASWTQEERSKAEANK